MKRINTTQQRPIVMSLSGHDPSGGAGIQADIETLQTLGCHAATIITCLSIQDSQNVSRIQAVDADWIREQAALILADFPVKAFKIGLVGSLENVTAIADIIKQHKDIPVILDPILAAGGGKTLSSDALVAAMMKQLLPHTTIITPNIPEAQLLTNQQRRKNCAKIFVQHGCRYALITGTHSESKLVSNDFYQQGQLINTQRWPRLPHVYHGSGCTLATALSAYLSKGILIEEAVKKAQKFTWHSLAQATKLGKGQHIPLRNKEPI